MTTPDQSVFIWLANMWQVTPQPMHPSEPIPVPTSGKSLECLATSDHFGKKLGRKFSVDESITSSSEYQDSELLQLPYDVLVLIFQALDHAPSQVAFALSCKQLALISQDITLTRSSISPRFAGSLPKEVFDIPVLMKQLSPWLPDHLKLCDHCLTVRPCDPEYWREIDGCAQSTFWVTKTGWNFANASWHKQVHNICPSCHVTCTLSDFVDCDGCRVLGRLGDVDWSRVSDTVRRYTEDEVRAGRFATGLGSRI